MELSDEALLAQFLEGDETAFRELVHRYETTLLNYLYRLVGDQSLAEEMVQETFLAVFQHAREFDPQARFRPWLYAIATNRTLNTLRRRRPRLDNESLSLAADPHPSPELSASLSERAQAVQTALQTLTENQRAIFILRFYQGLSYEEIAAVIGCPLGTVKSRICNAFKILRGRLWAFREIE